MPKADFSFLVKYSFLSPSISICCGGLVEACRALWKSRLGQLQNRLQLPQEQN
jgi:hypothetical protein